MILLLAFRHLLVKPVRAIVLLAGFGVGVGVMIVLLAVGEAMLEQSRDVSLIGGGEVTVLPEGIDLEALRTGASSAAFQAVDRARFVHRQVIDGPRHADLVATASPALEHQLVYLEAGGRVVTVRAGGEIPSRSAAAGAALDLVAGQWLDSAADSAWMLPSPGQLYHELDRWHRPPSADSSWAEWQYFNIVIGPDEWWYISYLVGGDMTGGDWGGQLLVTHRRPGGGHVRYSSAVPAGSVRFDTTAADIDLGGSTIRQVDGAYRLRGAARADNDQPVRFDLQVLPAPRRWFPPLEIGNDTFISGYVVPALRAEASGTICVGRGPCRDITAAHTYHDHNWGTWQGVTWEWGMGRGSSLDLLYGGVVNADSSETGRSPFFLAISDSLGVRQVLRFDAVIQEGPPPGPGSQGQRWPRSLRLVAQQGSDVTVTIDATDTHATAMGSGAFRRTFLQMRGDFELQGRIGGAPIRDRGRGFFETWRGGRKAVSSER